MMTVTINRDEMSLTAEGHCNAGPFGRDLVCAGASVLIDTYYASLQSRGLLREESWLDKGGAYIKAETEAPAGAYLDFCIMGLSMLGETFPDNIKVCLVG